MATSVDIGGVALELVAGDITQQPGFDAIVNAANAMLMPGGGVAGAIHRGAGAGLAEECRPLAPIAPGQSVITAGHELPNPWVIHCLGPVYGVDVPSDELLACCYQSALELADEQALESVAFTALSTGAFAYPEEAAAEVALRAVLATAPRLRSIRRVRFVLFGSGALRTHIDALARLRS